MEKIMKNERFIKVICILFAALLWIYVSYQENPSMSKTVNKVPLVITGEQALKENGLSVFSVSQQSVNVKVTAKRLSLPKLTNKTLSATINVSGITKSGKYTIPATVTLPGNSEASFYVKSKDITVIVEPIETKVHSVEAQIAKSKDSSVIVKSYTLSAETVSVSAPKSLMNEIGHISTEEIMPQSGGGSQTVKLIVYAKNGKILEGAECVPSQVTIDYFMYDVKKVPVVLKTTSGEKIPLPAQYSVDIYGTGDSFNRLKQIETQSIDLDAFEKNSTVTLTLDVPEDVFLVDSTPQISVELKESYFN